MVALVIRVEIESVDRRMILRIVKEIIVINDVSITLKKGKKTRRSSSNLISRSNFSPPRTNHPTRMIIILEEKRKFCLFHRYFINIVELFAMEKLCNREIP